MREERQTTVQFDFGAGYAMYRGPIGEGSAHRHGAFQIAIGTEHDVTVVDGVGHEYCAATLVIAPMFTHCLRPSTHLTTYFVEPQCTFAEGLRRYCRAGVSAAPHLRDTLAEGIPVRHLAPSAEFDPRLVEALSLLADCSVSLNSVAQQVGVSLQRLRALARRDLGMPLTRWRVWARLRRAAQAIQVGQSLADAAATAGFADQAHLTRQMREMMGLTPATVLPLLRRQSLHAV